MPKDIATISKRRRNQLILEEIARHNLTDNQPSSLCTVSLGSNCHKNLLNYSIDNNVFNEQPLTSLAPFDTPSAENVIYANDVGATRTELITKPGHPACIESHQNCYGESSCSDTLIETGVEVFNNSNASLVDDLRRWTIQSEVSHRNVNTLLTILRKHGSNNLPVDVRTLLRTPRNPSSQIIAINGGKYVHFGLMIGLRRSIRKYFNYIPDLLEININCDGLPLFKSSRGQFWPILVSITMDFCTEPFVVGIHHSDKKPDVANIFLNQFINEMVDLLKNGLEMEGCNIRVRINAIVCDTPAKSFITYTKGHNGYFGCSKCTQEGDFVCRRMTFPEINCHLRTDDSFRQQLQPEHHFGVSDLLRLNIGLVSHVALDYMHLICLGVVKRLIIFWVKGPKIVRFSKEQLNVASQILLSMKFCIPKEFARKPRSLDDIDRWKATELRQFLLYTGPLVLKSVLPQQKYHHFLALSVAIRILCDPKLCSVMNDYARSLLRWFVSHYGELYGPEYISYNVHNLVHLADEVRRFGCLDRFSAFQFENCLQAMKKKVKNSKQPLHQIVNRITEQNCIPIETRYRRSYPIVHFMRATRKIKFLEFDGFSISTRHPDNVCRLIDNSIIVVKNIFSENSILYIKGNMYGNTGSLFSIPCDSEKFNISLIDEKCTSDLVTLLVSKIARKCSILQHPEETVSRVVIPLLHYNN